jgi:hypothetical protein
MTRRTGDWLSAAAAALALSTACYVHWGLLTPGDSFANGSPFFLPTFLAAFVIGGVVGYKSQAVGLRALVFVAAICAACFWLLVPDGWWVNPPPRPS